MNKLFCTLLFLTPTIASIAQSIQQDLYTGVPLSSILSNNPVDSLYGKTYEGGYIFFIDSVNANGIVAAPFDLSMLPLGVQWSNLSDIVTNATLQFYGEGKSNTDTIVAQQGSTSSSIQRYAALKCDTSNANGLSDWYLPSKWELNAMYNNLHALGHGNFQSFWYWSSSEVNLGLAWAQNFQDGSRTSFAKMNIAQIRAARTFGGFGSVGIKEIGYVNVKLYPNPTKTHFSIQGIHQPYSITIYNSIGELLYQKTNITNENMKFKLSEYTNGLYFVQIKTNDQVYFSKILKH